MEVGLGLVAEADVNVGGLSFQDSEPYSLLHTSYALPTACMSFDAGAKSYVAATAAAASATTTGHGGAKSGAAPGVIGAQGTAGLNGMMLVAGLMVVGSVFFALL